MVLALAAAAIVVLALLSEVVLPRLDVALERRRVRLRQFPAISYDPGRERRAEQRARTLLRSCVNDEEWAMYHDLGFVRVWGMQAEGPHEQSPTGGAPYAYLIYPHKPIVAYIPQTGALLNEYCVAFPDLSRPYGSPRLPDSDDVLAKWMALMADERRLIADANMHLPGRQVDPVRVRRDMLRLARWEQEQARERPGRDRSGPPHADTLHA